MLEPLTVAVEGPPPLDGPRGCCVPANANAFNDGCNTGGGIGGTEPGGRANGFRDPVCWAIRGLGLEPAIGGGVIGGGEDAGCSTPANWKGPPNMAEDAASGAGVGAGMDC